MTAIKDFFPFEIYLSMYLSRYTSSLYIHVLLYNLNIVNKEHLKNTKYVRGQVNGIIFMFHHPFTHTQFFQNHNIIKKSTVIVHAQDKLHKDEKFPKVSMIIFFWRIG